MLNSLTIRNIALIDSLELKFGERLNVLSGETGAGKSIIIDSLNLLLGARFDKGMLRHNAAEGLVEGIFTGVGDLGEEGIDCDGELIITRKLFADGKSEVRINGKLNSAIVLRNIASNLISIYGQNEHQILLKAGSHLKILDYYARHNAAPLLQKVASLYAEYRNIDAQIKEFADSAQNERNIEIYKYQIDEIDTARVNENEEEGLLEKRKKFLNAEKIASGLAAAKEALFDSDRRTASEAVAAAITAIGKVTGAGAEFEELFSRLEGIKAELKEVGYTLNGLDDVEYAEAELDKIERRLDVIAALKRKYGGNYTAISKFRAKAQEELDKLLNSAELLESLEEERNELSAKLHKECAALSKVRQTEAIEFEAKVSAELKELGMPNVVFKIEFDEKSKQVRADGWDNPQFLLSPNIGEPLKPLIKIISGGELSRFMLAVKVITSAGEGAGTLIFDEVDAGISGIIGQAVAKKLAKIALNHQVLCVTHLPQIAAMADNQFRIDKREDKGRTATMVAALDREGMIDEIARLSGAKNISTEAISNARQMKEWTDEFKKIQPA